MWKFHDLTGQKFGRLEVIKYLGIDNGKHSLWLCQCDCGKQTKVNTCHLKSGHTKSCGCLHKQSVGGEKCNFYKHGKTKTRQHNLWAGIIDRCYNPKNQDYYNYGGRGIAVCKEWLDKEKGFINFYNWAMTNGYKDDLTIDRINNNKDYSPDNCRWATWIEQAKNRRCNHLVTYEGETHNLKEWAKIKNISYRYYL